MTTFVLVHGAWHGAWCWHRLVPLLEAQGHKVLTPDLPGHGIDATPIAGLALADYARAVAAVVSAAREPVVLVGHSLGGLVISQAAEFAPDRLRRLVYLAAFLPVDGDSCSRMTADDTESLANRCTAVDREAGVLRLAGNAVRAALCADGPAESIALAARCLRPEPLAPLTEPVQLSAAAFGSVPRAYIECTDDRTIPLARQRWMQSRQACERVITLPCSHSPFFSMPEQLAACLTDLAA